MRRIRQAHPRARIDLSGFTLPGDISASSRYFAQDVIVPEVNVDPDGTVEVPERVGLGFEINLELVKRKTEFDAEAPVGTSGNLQHRIDLLTRKDLLIAISFGRCLRETVESVKRAHQRGVPTFGITDSVKSPS